MKPLFVDLFSGIGVGTLGFVKAGLEIATAVEIDPAACELFERNLGVKPICGDIHSTPGSKILKKAGLKRGELPLLVGCPPCQSFSTLRRTRLVKGQWDTRRSLIRIFGDRVNELLPKVVILENVRGLTLGRNRRFLNEFIRRLRALHYQYAYDVLDAADFGVPQHRERLILIASRDGVPALPEATHSESKSLDGKSPWKTVKDAISNLHPLAAGESDEDDPLHSAPLHTEGVLRIIRSIPHDGGGRRSLPTELWLPCHKRLFARKSRGAESIYGRMRWKFPSPTITTGCHQPSCGRFLHPDQDRAITLREAARLQSIPDDFEIDGYKNWEATWIGNAMPADLATAVGSQAILYV